jgi:hypothetical protein
MTEPKKVIEKVDAWQQDESGNVFRILVIEGLLNPAPQILCKELRVLKALNTSSMKMTRKMSDVTESSLLLKARCT